MTTTSPTTSPTTVTRAAVRARDLTKTYGSGDTRVVALDHVDVEIAEGELTAIMGPSGSGKSTLMHCAAGLDDVTSGQVWVGDTDLTTLDDTRLTLLRREQVGFVFQAFNLPRMVRACGAGAGPDRSSGAQADRALRRAAAARGGGPRPRHAAARDLCRRADGRPRQRDRARAAGLPSALRA